MGEEVIVEWAGRSVAAARRSKQGFASAHLDDIGATLSSPTSLHEASSLVTRAASALAAIGAAGRMGLAIPVGVSHEIDLRAPGLEPWPNGNAEPPSLYYFEPSFWAIPGDREEYRCPYPPSDAGDLQVRAEYVCGRSLAERARGWEFSRTVWLFALPEDA